MTWNGPLRKSGPKLLTLSPFIPLVVADGFVGLVVGIQYVGEHGIRADVPIAPHHMAEIVDGIIHVLQDARVPVGAPCRHVYVETPSL